jgi:hypothetical protein
MEYFIGGFILIWFGGMIGWYASKEINENKGYRKARRESIKEIEKLKLEKQELEIAVKAPFHTDISKF